MPDILYYNLIGYAAIVFSILAFLSNTTFKMRVFGLFSSSFAGISIYGYGGLNGLFVSFVSFSIKALSLKFKEETLKPLIFASPVFAFTFFFFFNPEGLIGILPAISLIFIITATLQKDVLKMKYIYYGSAFSWLIYGIILESIPSILFDIFNLIALTYSIFKIKKERNQFPINDLFEIKPSNTHGKGLFSIKDIEKGTKLIFLEGVLVDLSNTKTSYPKGEWNCLGDGKFLTRKNRTFYGYINHSRNPNTFIDKNTMVVITLQDIAAHSEILLDYRKEPLPDKYLQGHGSTYL